MIPEKIKIGGMELTVKYEHGLGADRDRFSEFSAMYQEIRIDDMLLEDKKEESLMHEIVEAVDCYYELGLEHSKVTILGCVLHQIMKDNNLNFYKRQKD